MKGNGRSKMKLHGFKIMLFVVIGVLFLSVSFGFAETAEEYYNRGLVSCKQGNFTQAISDFSNSIEINPNFASAYYSLGWTYSELGRAPGAFKNLNQALELSKQQGNRKLEKKVNQELDYLNRIIRIKKGMLFPIISFALILLIWGSKHLFIKKEKLIAIFGEEKYRSDLLFIQGIILALLSSSIYYFMPIESYISKYKIHATICAIIALLGLFYISKSVALDIKRTKKRP